MAKWRPPRHLFLFQMTLPRLQTNIRSRIRAQGWIHGDIRLNCVRNKLKLFHPYSRPLCLSPDREESKHIRDALNDARHIFQVLSTATFISICHFWKWGERKKNTLLPWIYFDVKRTVDALVSDIKISISVISHVKWNWPLYSNFHFYLSEFSFIHLCLSLNIPCWIELHWRLSINKCIERRHTSEIGNNHYA